MSPTIGLLINPVAGVGGPAGLKGSDGAEVQAAARERGARERAGERGIRALKVLAAAHPGIEVITAGGSMGADVVAAAGLSAQVVHHPAANTSAADTAAAAHAIAVAGADLLLFVGGDGTARDVAAAVGADQPVLGIPAGVKMYSACFAVSPAAAGALAAHWLDGSRVPVEQREVLDVDESQIREGRVDPRLFALVSVPFMTGRTQSRKSATPASEAAAVRSAASGAIVEMVPGTLYLLGPGGTTAEIGHQLGIATTPLGVDIVRDGILLLADASDRQILETIAGQPTKAVVTVIGGQGFVLGRGNQQFSPAVLSAIGENPLMVVATERKLIALGGRTLLVDTGDDELDRSLTGYLRVVTGVRSSGLYPVTAPD